MEALFQKNYFIGFRNESVFFIASDEFAPWDNTKFISVFRGKVIWYFAVTLDKIVTFLLLFFIDLKQGRL